MGVIPKNPHEPITDDMWAELERNWPNVERLVAAWRLARDVDTCSDLIAGCPVDQARLNPEAVFEARRKSLVTLSAPIDLVNVEERAA